MGDAEPRRTDPTVAREPQFPGLEPLEEIYRLTFLEQLTEAYQAQVPEAIRSLIPQYVVDIAAAVHEHPLADEDTGIDREFDDLAALADFSTRSSQTSLEGWGLTHPDIVLEVMDVVRGEFKRISRESRGILY